MEATKLQNTSAVLRFMLAGNATFTLRSLRTGTRFTFKVTLGKRRIGSPETYFIKLLTGSNNESDYSLFGMLRNKKFVMLKKSRIHREAKSVSGFVWFFKKLSEGILPEHAEFWHEGRCGKCGRKLTVPESLTAGFGAECESRMAA